MKPHKGLLQKMILRAQRGTIEDIDFILKHLNKNSSFAITRYVDYALSIVGKEEGKERLKYYLFEGSPIQRNYISLYFNRLGEWQIVKKAYEKGLIDEVQAFAR